MARTKLAERDSPRQLAREDGASKAYVEARYYADAFWMAMVCLRNGRFLARPFDETSMRTQISPRYMAHLVRRGPDRLRCELRSFR